MNEMNEGDLRKSYIRKWRLSPKRLIYKAVAR